MAKAGFETGHIGLNVTDLERSREFYREVFAFQVVEEASQNGRRYAFLGDGSRLVLTLWQQAAGKFAAQLPGLHHLSFQVGSVEELKQAEARLRQRGIAIVHDGIVAHGEGADSGGFFFEDPDGIRLEIYAPSGLRGAPVPTPGAPSCGFF